MSAAPVIDITPLATVLTADELAELLRVNRKTVYAMVARGEIPGVRRIGGRPDPPRRGARVAGLRPSPRRALTEVP